MMLNMVLLQHLEMVTNYNSCDLFFYSSFHSGFEEEKTEPKGRHKERAGGSTLSWTFSVKMVEVS